MRIQLWSCNYDPEPQGIAPLTTVVAQALAAQGNDVVVVAAHPHYPKPAWGRCRWPYRVVSGEVPVIRLPLWVGRRNARQRVRQELSFTAWQSMVAPLLPRCDVLVAVTPSFAALAPAMAFGRARGVPWVMWVQDLVTDAAATTGLLGPGKLLRVARHFERAAYASTARIVVVSDTFRRTLIEKGVPREKIVRIYNPLTRPPEALPERSLTGPPRILAMGNIGHSQGLERIVEAFERSSALRAVDSRLILAGEGVRAAAVCERCVTDRVIFTGMLSPAQVDREMALAFIGLVSQRPDISEFNLPSKLMNYMGHGVPVLASVRPGTETARIVTASGAGWVTDAACPDEFARVCASVIGDQSALRRAGAAGFVFAHDHFHPARIADQFSSVLEAVAAQRAPTRPVPARPRPRAVAVREGAGQRPVAGRR